MAFGVRVAVLDMGNEMSLSTCSRRATAPRALTAEERRSFDRLLELYRPYLREEAERILPWHLASRLDGSDLVQDTTLRAAQEIETFRGTTHSELLAWLRQILQNLAIDWTRHHLAQKRDIRKAGELRSCIPGRGESPSSAASRQEEVALLAAAMRRLSPDQRLAVELRSEGHSFEEIGRQLNRSPDAVRMLWGRAIRQLTKQVAPGTECGR